MRCADCGCETDPASSVVSLCLACWERALESNLIMLMRRLADALCGGSGAE